MSNFDINCYLGTWRASGKSGFINELPPSTATICPVTNDASSLHSSAHTFATSDGVTRLRIGIQPALTHSFSASCTSLGVCPITVVSSDGPGLTAFTVMPWRASATAKYLHMLSTAALAEPIPTQGCHPPVTPPVYKTARESGRQDSYVSRPPALPQRRLAPVYRTRSAISPAVPQSLTCVRRSGRV